MFVSLFLLFSIGSAQISYPEVEFLVRSKNIRSVEGLLNALPENYKTNYTLLKKSSAVQKASLQNPRAVIYGETGELTLTFNSSPDHGGYNDVEFLAYDKIKKEFELRVITFTGSEAVFSEKNPTQCTHCHGLDPRPLWDNYPFWQNAFGTKLDVLTPQEEETLKSTYFREHPRFKEIIKKDADPLYPFNAPPTFGPNATLGKLYTSLQGEANVERVLNSQGYKHSENLGILALIDCHLDLPTKRKLEDFYILKIKEIYPDQTATLEWWIRKYAGEPFYLTLLQSVYLFGIDYFQNNYFNLKMRYHEEHLSSDSGQSVRDATIESLKHFIKNPQLKELLLTNNRELLCKKIVPVGHKL